MRVGIGIFTAPEAGGAYQYTRSVIKAASVLLQASKEETKEQNVEFICYSLFEMWEPICKKIGVPFKKLSETKLQKAVYHLGYLLGQIGSYDSKFYNSRFYQYHPLWKAYDEDNLDVMMITSPSWYGKPDGKKLVMPIFDVMHRYIDFPEIGEGKIGAERDRRYASICKGADVILADSKVGVMQIIDCYGDVCESLIRKVHSLPFIVPDYIDADDEGNEAEENPTRTKDENSISEKVPEKYILYPAQFWMHKNHVGLLRAAGELKKQGTEVNLVLTGSGKNAGEKIEKTIQEYNLEDNVTNLGYISDEDLVGLYKHARAMMFPSFGGPTNIPPLEAMALGCPVAVSNNFAMPEQIDGAGLTFNPSSVNDIQDAMRRLWTDDILCEKLSQSGLARSKEWTVKEFAKELLNCITSIADK